MSYLVHCYWSHDFMECTKYLNDYLEFVIFLFFSCLSLVTGGCSNNNGGCQRFCFTMPSTDDSADVSNEYRCACPTGFSLQADNRSCNTSEHLLMLVNTMTANFGCNLFSSAILRV